MLAGMHNAENKINTVLKARPDLDLSLKIKRERMRAGQYRPLAFIESIVFENDRDCQLSSLDERSARRARHTGRSLYWPHSHPVIGITIPEEDLIFVKSLKLPLPDVPDPEAKTNPYKVDRYGKSHLRKNEGPEEAPLIKQRPEEIASAKYQNFLIFHPVAQITTLTKGGFGVFGSHQFPLSCLTGFDDKKMAVLIDPYTGEAFFYGGRWTVDIKGQYTGPTEAGGKSLVGHFRL